MLNKKDKSLKSKKGFTLTEVLVTVIIIGVLAAIAYPVFSKSIAKARATEAVNLLEMVRNKQIQNYATKGVYASDLKKLGPLTNSKTTSSDSTMVVNDNYYVSLDKDNACASVAYKKSGADPLFTFSSGYETSGLGCSGNVCSSFGDIIGEADTVCNIALPEEPVEPEIKDCPPGGGTQSCGLGGTRTCECDTSTGTWGNCTPCTGEGVCDNGNTQTCTSSEGTGCKQTCSNYQWGSCVCDNVYECTPGSAGSFQSCSGTCKADGSGYECTGDTDSHYCSDKNTCLALDKTCPQGTEQKQTCDDGVTVLTRTFNMKGGWSCEFNTSACKCEPKK